MIQLLVLVFVVVLICAVAVWVIGQIPGVPAIVPKIIWVFGVLIILWLLLTAVGLTGDISVPRVR